MKEGVPRVAYLTAGAGGMFCGSCLHDNALAKALIRRGLDVQLIPTYTPIRTDEDSVAQQRVFLGGLNLYLSQTVPGWRFLPRPVTAWLDHPSLIRWATQRASSTSAKSLGALTVSMLQGTRGYQKREIEELCRWLAVDLRPDLVVLSNILIAGGLARLRQALDVPFLVTLQGDDIFLDSLPDPYKTRALAEIAQIVPNVSGFISNSRFYADFMSRYLGIPRDQIHVVPLGIDVTGFPAANAIEARYAARSNSRRVIGYLARLAPEKGLHVLIDAFIELRRTSDLEPRLTVAGWLGEHNRPYVEQQKEKIARANLVADVTWAGELDRQSKIDFLKGIDLFSVPTTYAEPKGLYVLEALAAGVPVVQPAHGAFPELIEATRGGNLVPPNDPVALASALDGLLRDESIRRTMAREGHAAVHTQFNADAMAQATWSVLAKYLRAEASNV